MHDSLEIKDDQEEIKESQEEIKDDKEVVKKSQKGVKESQEEIKESGIEINDNQDITEEETTETIKTGRKTTTRQITKKDGNDQQTTGKVLATVYHRQ